MKYIVLAGPYYEWKADQLRQHNARSKRTNWDLEAETGTTADARWMSELFQIITQVRSDGTVKIRGIESGSERVISKDCLAEYPNLNANAA